MDQQDTLQQQVNAAIASGTPLLIQGGGSKAFYGEQATGEPLDLSGHSGVVDYDPGELVITCRSGSKLEDIRRLLAENGQHLPFEPPAFGDSATIGGTVACGFSGPARPWAGSLRDYLLGVKIINGRGEVLRFGGQVMKNVAGYDVSRLMAGAMGTLGVLLELSFKVLPLPARSLTLSFECEQGEAIRRVNEWSAMPLPLSAASWTGGELKLRLSGAVAETEKAAHELVPLNIEEDPDHWLRLREHQGEFFGDETPRSRRRPAGPGWVSRATRAVPEGPCAHGMQSSEAAFRRSREQGSETPLWRLSIPAKTPPLALEGDCLLDWGGAQRWYSSAEPAEKIRAAAENAGGHATLFRGAGNAPCFHPLPPAMRALQQRIRLSFDPATLFNPGRMGRER